MHDLDRTDVEFEEDYEDDFTGEYEYDDEFEFEGAFDEAEEMELASELLEVADDAELEQFLGKIFKKVKRLAKKAVKGPLGGILKGIAKKALPIAGGALGSFFGGPVGGALGSKAGSMATKLFGLELEALEGDDLEFEAARKFVRLAGEAATKAAKASTAMNPTTAARAAVLSAAKNHAPGLLKTGLGHGSHLNARGFGGRSGRWIRRGRRIIVMGA